MKNYILGFALSLVFLVILIVVNRQVYSNVMSSSVLFHLLVLHVIFCKNLITDKKRLQYVIFVVVFILSVYFSLPNLTYNQATEKVMDTYEMDIVETYTVPVQQEWNPFDPNRAYVFKGVNSKSEEVSIMVSASTGKVFVMDL